MIYKGEMKSKWPVDEFLAPFQLEINVWSFWTPVGWFASLFNISLSSLLSLQVSFIVDSQPSPKTSHVHLAKTTRPKVSVKTGPTFSPDVIDGSFQTREGTSVGCQ